MFEGEKQDCQEREFHSDTINCMIKNTADEGFVPMRDKIAGKLGIKGVFGSGLLCFLQIWEK